MHFTMVTNLKVSERRCQKEVKTIASASILRKHSTCSKDYRGIGRCVFGKELEKLFGVLNVIDRHKQYRIC